ncbi:MAG: ABC transporter ATP-binding protein [Flavobacteriales bacterium]|nr:ABC transporter ATP-binding protein [Flavobacteriales bacterium]
MVEFRNITKLFGNVRALDNLVAKCSGQRVVSLIGPNGSGKSTLIRCLLGLVVPSSGDILFEGKSTLGQWKYREKIGYMPQISRFPDSMKVRQLFEMLKEMRGKRTGCDEQLIDEFKLGVSWNKALGTLSGGTRQKVSACVSFLFDAPVLVLDEPTASLDPLASEVLKNKIRTEKQKGKLILVTTHILNDMDDLSTDVMYLQDGKLLLNTTLETLRERTGEYHLNKAIAQIMSGTSGEHLLLKQDTV